MAHPGHLSGVTYTVLDWAMSKPDGGPAFPSKREEKVLRQFPGMMHAQHFSEDVYYSGLSVRDYFAIKAMQAKLISSARPCWILSEDDRTLLSETSYAMADSMLKERGRA